MNIIERHAKDFIAYNRVLSLNQPQDFTRELKTRFYDYSTDAERLELTNQLIIEVTIDRADNPCNCGKPDCRTNSIYEDVLFYLRGIQKSLEENLGTDYLSPQDKEDFGLLLKEILIEINKLSLGQEIIHTDILARLNGSKDYMYMSKQELMELVKGKLISAIPAGAIAAGVGSDAWKNIVSLIENRFPELVETIVKLK